MATITMDSSEWEAMKKNIQLLEEAKKREEQLNDEIKKLQAEKMEVLKTNEKNVTIVKETWRHETIRMHKPMRQILTEVYHFVERAQRGYPIDNISDEEFIRMFFSKSEMNGLKVDETITTRGFDEVRAEFELKYKEELDENTKDRLSDIPKLEKEIKDLSDRLDSVKPNEDKLREDNFRLTKTNHELITDNDKLREDNFRLTKTNHELMTDNNKLKSHISEVRNILSPVLDSSWNIFNYSEMKSKLTTLIWQFVKI